jgi:hypothetical protein
VSPSTSWKTLNIVQPKAITIIAGFLIAGSCGKAREEQRKPVDPLMEVSPALAIHMVMGEHELQVCEVLRDYSTRQSATCAVLEKAARNNKAIAASVVATRSVPRDLFFFYEVEEGRGEKLISKAIGLFKSLDECKAAEEIYRSFDIATRPCRQWDGSSFILG